MLPRNSPDALGSLLLYERAVLQGPRYGGMRNLRSAGDVFDGDWITDACKRVQPAQATTLQHHCIPVKRHQPRLAQPWVMHMDVMINSSAASRWAGPLSKALET
jgi:hypothetical protein